jgi:flavodoxin
MNIIIVYDSQTGTTKKAAVSMGEIFRKEGHRCQELSISDARPDSLIRADLICIGSWVKGWFIIRQHPTEGIMNYLSQLKGVTGKDAIVFCTYKLAIGSTLRKMAEGLESQGVRVVGMFKFRGPDPNDQFAAFAASLK